MRSLAVRILFFFALIGLWEVLAKLNLWPDYLFPSPEGVMDYIRQASKDQIILPAVLASMRRLFVGYAISLVLGVLAGWLLAEFNWLKKTAGMLMQALQTLPSVCWLPIALLWFGLNDRAIIFVIVMGSMLSMAQATLAAIAQVPPLFIRVGRTLGARRLTLFTKVVFPAAYPALLEGMRQSWAFAWRSLLAGELLFVTPGIGQLLNSGRELNDINQVAGAMVIIVVIGVFFDKIVFDLAQKRAFEIRGLGTHKKYG